MNKSQFLYWEKVDMTWQEAAKACDGYGQANILERVQAATQAVIEGRAAYERDGVLFDEWDANWPLFAALEQVYIQQKKLHVIDFGGALGSTYYQHLEQFKSMQPLHWTIVEQANYVRLGQEKFAGNPQLDFAFDIETASANQQIDVILFACVLHYLETPMAFIEAAAKAKIPYLIIDSTPFNDALENHMQTIQYVPEKIYKAKYPCHIFSEKAFKKDLYQYYKPIWEYDNQISINLPCAYKGILLKLK